MVPVIKGATQVDDLMDKQIKEAIDVQLSQKDLSKVDGDKADLYIAYQPAIGTEKQFTSLMTVAGVTDLVGAVVVGTVPREAE